MSSWEIAPPSLHALARTGGFTTDSVGKSGSVQAAELLGSAVPKAQLRTKLTFFGPFVHV